MNRSLALAAIAVTCAACSPAVGLGWPRSVHHAAAPACGRDDLGRGTAFSEGATGAAVGLVVVRNVGSSRCAVRGIPRVLLVSAGGHALAVRQVGRPARGRAVVLRPGAAAQATFAWRNLCSGPGADHARLAWREAAVRLRPAGGGWVRRPRCDDAAAGSTLSIGPFTPRA